MVFARICLPLTVGNCHPFILSFTERRKERNKRTEANMKRVVIRLLLLSKPNTLGVYSVFVSSFSLSPFLPRSAEHRSYSWVCGVCIFLLSSLLHFPSTSIFWYIVFIIINIIFVIFGVAERWTVSTAYAHYCWFPVVPFDFTFVESLVLQCRVNEWAHRMHRMNDRNPTTGIAMKWNTLSLSSWCSLTPCRWRQYEAKTEDGDTNKVALHVHCCINDGSKQTNTRNTHIILGCLILCEHFFRFPAISESAPPLATVSFSFVNCSLFICNSWVFIKFLRVQALYLWKMWQLSDFVGSPGAGHSSDWRSLRHWQHTTLVAKIPNVLECQKLLDLDFP